MADEQAGYWRDRADQATRRRDHWKGIATTALTERDDARKELDTLRAKLKETEGAPARVKQLEGELKTVKHRSAFDAAAKAMGAKDKALDVLFRESGYKSDSDEPDEKAIGKALERLKESHDFAFEAAKEEGEEGEEKPAPKPEKKPSPETGRGKRADGKGTVTITRAMLADPSWALDPRNAEIKRTAKVID